MSSFTWVHYNKVLRDIFWYCSEPYRANNVIFQPSVLQIPYSDTEGWPMKLPEIPSTVIDDEFIVVLHFQDSLTYIDGVCVELNKIETHYPAKVHHNIVVVTEDIGLKNFYTGNLHIVWFPTFVYEMMYQMQHNKDQWDDYILAEPTKNWMCLNGIPKAWRKEVAYFLKDNHTNGILSLGDEIRLEKHAYKESYLGNDNPENFVLLDWVFKDAALNIVTETLYDAPVGILTEKTLFAFLAGQIPIVIAHQGFVTELKEMGFDMFEDVVNTSYDRYPDETRWKTALIKNNDLIQNGVKRSDYIERLEYNKQQALEVFPLYCINNYLDSMHSFGLSRETIQGWSETFSRD